MLEGVTIWTCCWSPEQQRVKRHLMVMQYCQRRFPEASFLFFCSEPISPQDFKVVSIPRLQGMPGWNYFVNYEVPSHIKTDFAMSVHEDGFPICTDEWLDAFLDYDYIGAPWHDGVVGNGGFNLESQRLLQLKVTLPSYGSDKVASDTWICRTHRRWFERRGIQFAPTQLATIFSTEHTGKQFCSFGFHGWEEISSKYNCAWNILNDTLNENSTAVLENT